MVKIPSSTKNSANIAPAPKFDSKFNQVNAVSSVEKKPPVPSQSLNVKPPVPSQSLNVKPPFVPTVARNVIEFSKAPLKTTNVETLVFQNGQRVVNCVVEITNKLPETVDSDEWEDEGIEEFLVRERSKNSYENQLKMREKASTDRSVAIDGSIKQGLDNLRLNRISIGTFKKSSKTIVDKNPFFGDSQKTASKETVRTNIKLLFINAFNSTNYREIHQKMLQLKMQFQVHSKKC